MLLFLSDDRTTSSDRWLHTYATIGTIAAGRKPIELLHCSNGVDASSRAAQEEGAASACLGSRRYSADGAARTGKKKSGASGCRIRFASGRYRLRACASTMAHERLPAIPGREMLRECPMKRRSLRGEIWFVQLHVAPPEKGRRPVDVVSLDARNRHERVRHSAGRAADDKHPQGCSTHVFLPAGETGLQSDSAARAEDITVVHKQKLVEPHSRLRQLSDRRVCELASKVNVAMGCVPNR